MLSSVVLLSAVALRCCGGPRPDPDWRLPTRRLMLESVCDDA